MSKTSLFIGMVSVAGTMMLSGCCTTDYRPTEQEICEAKARNHTIGVSESVPAEAYDRVVMQMAAHYGFDFVSKSGQNYVFQLTKPRFKISFTAVVERKGAFCEVRLQEMLQYDKGWNYSVAYAHNALAKLARAIGKVANK